tara:strand:- start:6075 stop:7679 length:1605 start_codon:yes stop_codon:yes gene_type:complete
MGLNITRVGDIEFDFQLDGGVVKSDIQPRLTTIDLLCDFKTGSGANLYQRVPLADITVIDTYGATGSFTFTTVLELREKLAELNFFYWATGSISGGVTRFDQLTDTPNYLNNDGKIPIVNEAQLKLDYISYNPVSTFVGLTDTPVNIPDGKMVVGVAGNKLGFATIPSEPQQFFNASGFITHADSGATRNYVAGTTIIENDLNGTKTDYTYRPYGVNNVFDSITNQFYFTDLRLGDKVLINLDFNVVTTVIDQNIVFKLKYAIGQPTENEIVIHNYIVPAIGNKNITFSTLLEMYSNDVINGRAELYLEVTDNCDLITNTFRSNIVRRDVNEVVISDNDSKADHLILGGWDADTNTPLLQNGVGQIGDYYIVSVAGSHDFGDGSIDFGLDDVVKFNGSIWFKEIDNNQSSTVTIKTLGGLSLLGTGDIPNSITITTGVSITTNTLGDSGNPQDVQNGKHINLNNGVNVINLTCDAFDNFSATYTKKGSGAITVIAGAGRTLFESDGTALIDGAKGSRFTITSEGTEDTLTISNK